MTRPLRSTPITGASPLLQAGPSAHPTTRAGPCLASRNPQPTVLRCAFSRSVRERQIRLTSPPCRTPPGQSAGTRQALPGMRSITPVLMPSVFVTTRQQRFACARLPDPHLTPLPAPFPRSLTTTVFSQRSTRWFEASPRRAAPKGPFLHLPNSTINHESRLPHRTPFDVRDTRSGIVDLLFM
jgi:hypothetical protein